MVLALTAVASAADPITETQSAGSPLLLGAGARALGIGAFTAIADDATAVTWNPPALTQLEQPEIGFSAGWYTQQSSVDDGETRDRDDISFDHLSAVLPWFAFGVQHALGIAYQRQLDFTRSYAYSVSDPDFVYDFDLRQRGSFSTLGATYAVEPLPTVSIGASFNWWDDDLTHSSRTHADITLTTTEISSALRFIGAFHTEQRVEQGFSVVCGLRWQAAADLIVAAVCKPEFDLDLETTTRGSGDSSYLTATTHETRLTYPTSATLALAWRVAEYDTIAAETTWTQWSRYMLHEDAGRRSPLGAHVRPDSLEDGFAVRAGYEHVFIRDWAILAGRFGAFYEEIPGARPYAGDALAATDATVDRYVGLSAGAGVVTDHVVYDVGAQWRHGESVGAGRDASIDRSADVDGFIVRMGATLRF